MKQAMESFGMFFNIAFAVCVVLAWAPLPIPDLLSTSGKWLVYIVLTVQLIVATKIGMDYLWFGFRRNVTRALCKSLASHHAVQKMLHGNDMAEWEPWHTLQMSDSARIKDILFYDVPCTALFFVLGQGDLGAAYLVSIVVLHFHTWNLVTLDEYLRGEDHV